MNDDTTVLSYWLNWRFFLCAIWVLTGMAAAAMIIWKYEGFSVDKTQRRDDEHETVGCLYKDEAWRTCSNAIHPAWLLAYRIIAFIVLLALLLVDIVIGGVWIFYYYTLWTFALVTLYFGIASSFSIYGCFYCCNEVDDDRVDFAVLDTERGTYVAPAFEENENLSSSTPINLISQQQSHVRETAGIWGYIFQVIFQPGRRQLSPEFRHQSNGISISERSLSPNTSAGAVMVTDSVFWFVIYPLFTSKAYKLTFLEVSMHSLNAVFLFGDIIVNQLRFPFFRIAYFVQLTCIFVIFQWTIHACVPIGWPYQFMELSSPYAPIWYLAIGLFHLPCYGILNLIVRSKQVCLSRLSY